MYSDTENKSIEHLWPKIEQLINLLELEDMVDKLAGESDLVQSQDQ